MNLFLEVKLIIVIILILGRWKQYVPDNDSYYIGDVLKSYL